jgi:hypothetical protein
MRHQVPDEDLFCGSGSVEPELRQVLDHRRVQVEDATLDLLKDEHRGHDLGDRAEEEAGVLAHRCAGGHVGEAVGEGLQLATLVDADEVAGNTGGLAEVRDPCFVHGESFEGCPRVKVKRRAGATSSR